MAVLSDSWRPVAKFIAIDRQGLAECIKVLASRTYCLLVGQGHGDQQRLLASKRTIREGQQVVHRRTHVSPPLGVTHRYCLGGNPLRYTRL
ncbi:hypothetical protein D3C76_1287260 [compost metagenome]